MLARREFLQIAGAAVATSAISQLAWALDYPKRPVRLVVAGAPGGGADIVARLTGRWLSERLGQPFVIDNRPGAASNIGTEVVVRAPPDGYTLLFVTAINAVNASVYDNLNFNFIRDIQPVASIARAPFIMVVNRSVPARTVPEFIDLAKANPGKINMASDGIGTGGHVAGELFKMMAGVDMVHVPYRGQAAALNGLVAGQVQVYFGALAGTIEYVTAGALRVLAVATQARLEALPEIPTVGDFLKGYEASGWLGIGAPKNTPAEIVARLNNEINLSLADPKLKAQLGDLGTSVLAGSPADFGKLIAEGTEKWAKVVKFAGVKPQ